MMIKIELGTKRKRKREFIYSQLSCAVIRYRLFFTILRRGNGKTPVFVVRQNTENSFRKFICLKERKKERKRVRVQDRRKRKRKCACERKREKKGEKHERKKARSSFDS